MSLNKTIKKIIEIYPNSCATRSEALIYLFCSKNNYKWVNGELVGPPSSEKKVTPSYKLPVEASKLIENMKRVNKKQAKAMELKYKKAHEKETDKLKKVLADIPKRVKSKSLPKKVDTFYSRSAIFKIPKNVSPSWKAAALETIDFVLKKDPNHEQAMNLKEFLS